MVLVLQEREYLATIQFDIEVGKEEGVIFKPSVALLPAGFPPASHRLFALQGNLFPQKGRYDSINDEDDGEDQ